MRQFKYIPFLTCAFILSCENKGINEGEAFRPREINEDFDDFHFNTINYEGVDYLITERDNNHPHEGFGFMAFRANKLIDKQDSILAHIQAIGEMQKLIYARLYSVPLNVSDSIYKESFDYYLQRSESP